MFPSLFSEDERDGCAIYSSYNTCGNEENFYDFQCQIRREGEEPEDCVENFLDPEFWAVMREEDYWQDNHDYQDFYDFVDEYHGMDDDDDDDDDTDDFEPVDFCDGNYEVVQQ